MRNAGAFICLSNFNRTGTIRVHLFISVWVNCWILDYFDSWWVALHQSSSCWRRLLPEARQIYRSCIHSSYILHDSSVLNRAWDRLALLVILLDRRARAATCSHILDVKIMRRTYQRVDIGSRINWLEWGICRLLGLKLASRRTWRFLVVRRFARPCSFDLLFTLLLNGWFLSVFSILWSLFLNRIAACRTLLS